MNLIFVTLIGKRYLSYIKKSSLIVKSVLDNLVIIKAIKVSSIYIVDSNFRTAIGINLN
jgi:hypothetical protein